MRSWTFNTERLSLAFARVADEVEQHGASAAVLAVASGNDVARIETFSRSDQIAVAEDGIFLLASISKPILATAIMTLVADGRLTLEEPVARHIPEIDAPGKPAITTWHLLTHTSGIGEIDWRTTLDARPRRAVGLDVACRYHLHFRPGTRFEYSTLSYWILAELITRLSGVPYERYLKDRVFDPLGMKDISFDPTPKARRMVPVEGIAMGQETDAASATDHFISLRMPGAGLWGTVADLLAFGRALLKDARGEGVSLLPTAYVALMTREHTAGIMRLHNTEPCPVHYGLGWRKWGPGGNRVLPGSGRVFEHDGATGGELWVDPEYGLVFVFLTNRFGADPAVWQVALQATYGALEPS